MDIEHDAIAYMALGKLAIAKYARADMIRRLLDSRWLA